MTEVFASLNQLLADVAAAATGIVGLGFVRLAIAYRGFVGHMLGFC